jgi:phospholipase C
MVDRRGFLKGSAAAVAAGAVGGGVLDACAPAGAPAPVTPYGPAGDAGIDHFIVLMMENRSLDHLLGWVPGADGKQAGLSFIDKHGASHDTFHQTEFATCNYEDPDHSYTGGRTEFDSGACDGFLLPSDDTFPISYYEQADLPFLGNAAPAWTLCDRYFAATMGPTFPNRIYQHAGQSDRAVNTITTSNLPTIWDRLKDKNLSGRYYYSDAPITALWGLKYTDISRGIDGFLSDCATGRLPHVSYVDPKFIIPTPFGTSADYHPNSDIRAGEKFIHQIYEAVINSPNWERTVLVINFDEWGGFYDHVAPEVAPDSNASLALRGFRVPCIVVSPYAKRGFVAHDTYDHASVLKMIEWGFDLAPLAPRDAAANNLADVLDLSSPPDNTAPSWAFPDVQLLDCSSAIQDQIMSQLTAQAHALGFG